MLKMMSQAPESYDSGEESDSSTEAIRAANRLVQADLGELQNPPCTQSCPTNAIQTQQLIETREEMIGSMQVCVEYVEEGKNCDGSCTPCLFRHSQLGCPRGDACRYCHVHEIGANRVPHRPRKSLRHKIKKTAEDLLRRFDTSPERVHDELQVGASGPSVLEMCLNPLTGGSSKAK